MKGNEKKSKKQALDADELLLKIVKRIGQLRIQKGYTSYEYFAYGHYIFRAQFGRY